MIQKKRALMMNLLLNFQNTLSNPSLKQTVSNLRDTIIHTAPEILDRRWGRIYQLCIHFINDANNEEHQKCFDFYQQALEEYKKIM